MSALKRAGKRAVRVALGGMVRGLADPQTDLRPARWDLAEGPSGLAIEGVPLAGLCARWGSPLHVVSAGRLAGNARAFRETPRGAGRGCEIFYSYKTNPLLRVLQLLHASGVGAEVTSDHELWLALRVGVPPERIILNGTAKSAAVLREAIGRGVALINLNGREELEEICAIARSLGKRPRVGIRVRADVTGWGSQLGERGAGALRAFADALARPELEVVGVHAHRGPEIATAGVLESFVRGVLAFCDLLRERLRFEPSIVDFGGSLCCPTVTRLTGMQVRLNRTFGVGLPPRDPSEALGIRSYLAALVGRTEAHYRQIGRPMPRLLLEPGRAMTGDTQLLLATTLRVKKNDGLDHAILDAGINVAQPLQTEFHAVFPVQPRQAPRRRYRLVGPISSPGDILCYSCELPEVAPGDVLAIMDTGAYFISSSSSFSFLQPGVVLVDGGEVSLVRRAETSEDLVSRDL